MLSQVQVASPLLKVLGQSTWPVAAGSDEAQVNQRTRSLNDEVMIFGSMMIQMMQRLSSEAEGNSDE